jgi:hypothetical protein
MYHDRTAWRCAFFVSKKYGCSKGYPQRNAAHMGSISLWISFAAVDGYFADLTKNHYRGGIMTLEHRWNKCIRLKGDYVE